MRWFATFVAGLLMTATSMGSAATVDTRCDYMLQTPVFIYAPTPGYVPCGLQEDEAGDVWSFIHEGHVRWNGALTDEDAWNWLVRHAGDGVILYP